MDQRRKVRSPRLRTRIRRSLKGERNARPRSYGEFASPTGGCGEVTELPVLLLDDLIPPQDNAVPPQDTAAEKLVDDLEDLESLTSSITRIISGFLSPITIETHPHRNDRTHNIDGTRATDGMSATTFATVTVESPGGITYHLPIDISQQNWERRLTRSLTDITGYCSS